jgi:hypothetical protein
MLFEQGKSALEEKQRSETQTKNVESSFNTEVQVTPLEEKGAETSARDAEKKSRLVFWRLIVKRTVTILFLPILQSIAGSVIWASMTPLTPILGPHNEPTNWVVTQPGFGVLLLIYAFVGVITTFVFASMLVEKSERRRWKVRLWLCIIGGFYGSLIAFVTAFPNFKPNVIYEPFSDLLLLSVSLEVLLLMTHWAIRKVRRTRRSV